MRRFSIATVVVASLIVGVLGAVPAAQAWTVTIGQVAGADQVGLGTRCTDCRNFQRSTDVASPSYVVPAGNWVLTSWSTRAGAAATGVRMFLVEAQLGGNYTLRGQSDEVVLQAERINTYPRRIPLQTGWRLGLDSGEGHTASYETFNADDVMNGYTNETVGTSAPISGQVPGSLVNVSAKLESDADLDGYGDETQDQWPGPGPGPGPGPAPVILPVIGPAATPTTCRGIPATIVGTAGPDRIAGTVAADVIAALGGNDTVSALGGKDVVCGGPGKDTLIGGKGKDTLLGQKGKDTLKGGGGKDLCNGGKGRDRASKCELEKKKKPAYVPPAQPPAPLYLSDSEAYNAVREDTYQRFLSSGPGQNDPTAFWGVGDCSRESAYQVRCRAFMGLYAPLDYTCQWVAVVTRIGYAGLSLTREDELCA